MTTTLQNGGGRVARNARRMRVARTTATQMGGG